MKKTIIHSIGYAALVIALSACCKKKPIATTNEIVQSEPVSTRLEAFRKDVGDRVFFDFDSANLTEAAKSRLQQQKEWLEKNGISAIQITISAGADERGTTEYNMALTERRAEAVKSYLASLGYSGKIETVACGKEFSRHGQQFWAEDRFGMISFDNASPAQSLMSGSQNLEMPSAEKAVEDTVNVK